MAFQLDFNGLMVGDEVSVSEFGRFGAAPRVFVIKAVGGNEHDNKDKRWISAVGMPKTQEADKLYERDGWRVEILKH